MGYDVIVLDESGSARLGATELLPAEHAALVEAASVLGLIRLGNLPPYWGEERRLSVHEIHAMDLELDRIRSTLLEEPELESAIAKMRGVFTIARRHQQPLFIVPD